MAFDTKTLMLKEPMYTRWVNGLTIVHISASYVGAYIHTNYCTKQNRFTRPQISVAVPVAIAAVSNT